MNEGQPQPGCSKDSDNRLNTDVPLQYWTKEEKFELLQALKAKGSHNIPGIMKYFPHKSVSDVKQAISFYKSKTVKCVYRDRRRKKPTPMCLEAVPLSNWARLLVERIGIDNLQTEVATALRIMAEFEDFPGPEATEKIDLRNAYHLLANAVEGKELQEDRYLSAVINKSLLETALTSKAFIRATSLQQVLSGVVVSDKTEPIVKRFPKMEIKNLEAASVENLCLQKNYNPLNFSEELMRPESN